MKKSFMFMSIVLCLIILPNIVKASSEAQKKIGFQIYGGLNYLDGDDINRGIKGMFDYWKYRWHTEEHRSGPGEFQAAHFGLDVGGEVIYPLTSRVSVGIGLGYMQTSSSTTFQVETSSPPDHPFFDYYWKPRIYAFPITTNVIYSIPFSSSLRMKIRGGIGYYFAKINYSQKISIKVPEVDYDIFVSEITSDAKGIGFHGGLSLEYMLSQNKSFFFEIRGRYANFSGIKGTQELFGNENNGYLYYYVYQGFPMLELTDKMPTSRLYATGLRGWDVDYRKARINLSGISFVVGFALWF